jgi:hypothetical protein
LSICSVVIYLPRLELPPPELLLPELPEERELLLPEEYELPELLLELLLDGLE